MLMRFFSLDCIKMDTNLIIILTFSFSDKRYIRVEERIDLKASINIGSNKNAMRT